MIEQSRFMRRNRFEMRRGEMMPLERSGAFTLPCIAVLLIVAAVMASLF